MSEYFPKRKSLEANVKVELDLSNYATKADLNATQIAKKTDLANLKSDINKLDINKWKNVPTNSSNLKSKEDKFNVNKLVPVPFDLTELSDLVVPVLTIQMNYVMC